MFSDNVHCPCISGTDWSSHEESCGAAGRDCIACPYCMANITYWGRVDEVLGTSTSLTQRRFEQCKHIKGGGSRNNGPAGTQVADVSKAG